jgi:arylsulfatase A-like enzyme
MPEQPCNVVWICADDFRPDICGTYGNRRTCTPNLDRLAAEGMRFDRAFCTCPLSTPSRQSFWTGRYPRSIGVTFSPTPLPEDETTLPVLLRRAGYEVAAFGKTHYYFPRREEFDHCIDYPEYEAWLLTRPRWPLPPGPVLGPWRPFRDPSSVWLNAAALPYPAWDADMFGTFLSQHAARYLAAPKSRPFFVYVSYYETHSPFAFPVEFRDRHDPRDFPVPSVTADDGERIPPVFRDLNGRHKQGIQAAYATSAEYLDKNVGLVLDALDRSPCAANTLVVFTSDHGYLLGEHGRFEKHCCYEPAVRAALILRAPGKIAARRSTSALVELLDLVPTILHYAGVTQPANLHGRSLVPLLEGATTHRDHVIAEYADNAEAMIRTGRWKLIYSTGQRRRADGYALDRAQRGPASVLAGTPDSSAGARPFVQLFDLVADPDEITNLATRPEHSARIGELLDLLADHLRRTDREPALLPRTENLFTLLDYCLTPRRQ